MSQASAPLQRVLRKESWHPDNRAYYVEKLECGHIHLRSKRAPKARRRRCWKCAMQKLYSKRSK